MRPVARIMSAYRRIDTWIRARPRVHLALLVVVPATTMAVTAVMLGMADGLDAVSLGLVFGLVYGSLTYFWGGLDSQTGRTE